MILLSPTVPLFAPSLRVGTLSNTSQLGTIATASSPESGQRLGARVAITGLLHPHAQICRTALGLAAFSADTFQKQTQATEAIPRQGFWGC